MSSTHRFKIAVLPGDGIGPEVIMPAISLIEAAAKRVGGIAFDFETLPAGAACYRDTGTAFPDDSRAAAVSADAILLGAMGLPDVRYPDGTEISPQLDLRFDLGLYAGLRPVRLVPGLALPLRDPRAADIDLVLIRESTEGLFASHGKGTVHDDRVARDTLEITRETSERLFDTAFELACRRRQAGRPGRVTCVDKANVFTSFAFFRRVFDERALRYPDVHADHCYVDAMALNLVRQPWQYDVLVTENMFGDILSDLGAALMGGMGMAPSADIGSGHAVFQPCHGSAPDIVGKGAANPTATILSAAMMLDWLGRTREVSACTTAAGWLQDAVDTAFARGDLVPVELGGDAGTAAIARAVSDAMDEIASQSAGDAPARIPAT